MAEGKFPTSALTEEKKLVGGATSERGEESTDSASGKG